MPTADCTILPPPFPTRDPRSDEEPHSGRSLNAVGVQAVLGAMIEHRRASQPSFASVVVPSQGSGGVLELSEDEVDDDHARDCGAARAPSSSEVFLKAR